MDPQQPALSQAAVQNGVWAPFYGAAFVNQCVHPQLQQLADVQWRVELSAKLAAILEKLRERFARSQNVCLCQTWIGADGSETTNPNSLEVTLWADPRLAIVLDPLFQELRIKSCQGPVFFRNSMPGKVWRSGAVQIVQNLRILPPTLHPRSQLSEEALERLAEALYIPIYDLARPAKGQVCVLEVLLSTRATEAMLVADVISFISNLLTALHLSLANPVQQPVRRSVLCGRRARAPDSDGEASGGEGQQVRKRQEEAGAQGGQRQEGPPGSGCAAGSSHGVQAQRSPHGSETGAGGGAGGGACPHAAPGVEAAQVAAAAQAGGAPEGGRAAVLDGRVEGAAPACSEQPTLPASPSHERLARAGDPAAAAAGPTAALAPSCPGEHGPGGPVVMPRKLRKLLEGAMQRSKSVVSVAALSDGIEAEDDEEDEEAGEDLRPSVALCSGPGSQQQA